MEMGAKAKQFQSLWRVGREFRHYLKPYRWAIAGAFVLIILQVWMSVLEPWPLKMVIDHVLKSKPILPSELPYIAEHFSALERSQRLNWLCGFMVVTTAFCGIFTYLANSRITSIGQHITYDIRRDLFLHLQKLSIPYFEGSRTGDIVTRINSDISNIQDLMVSFVKVLLVNIALMIGITFMMFRVDAYFTVISLGVVPFLYAVMRSYISRIKNSQRKGRSRLGELASVVQEFVSSVKMVQAFVREEHEAARFDVPNRSALRSGLNTTELQSQFTPSVESLTAFATALIVFVGARQVFQEQMTLGTLILFLSYLKILYNPVKQLSKLVNVQSKAMVSAERIAELLDTLPGIKDSPGALKAKTFAGAVRFEKVGFEYPARTEGGAPAKILEEIDLEVRPGMTVAIVGPTGTGKTTLLSLLPRFHEVSAGRILVDGQDIRTLTLESLRGQISMVLQEAVLFRGTVWENIAYGSPDFPAGFGPEWLSALVAKNPEAAQKLMGRIEEASRAANAHEFISKFPLGYHTELGERGASLSGGQRQRIAIARAMIRNAPLLILDEPTTGLDAESEQMVMEALERLAVNRTTFVIAHHLSTVRRADLILVLENHRVVESGSHDELYQRGGRYRYYCDIQFEPEVPVAPFASNFTPFASSVSAADGNQEREEASLEEDWAAISLPVANADILAIDP